MMKNFFGYKLFRNKKTLKQVKLPLLFIMLLLTVNYATSPKQPCFEYTVSGTVQCDTLSLLSNYTVQVFGKHQEYAPVFTALKGLRKEGEQALTLTDTNGCFYICVNSFIRFDSIKAGVVLAGESFVASGGLEISRDNLRETITYFSANNGSGCSCTTEPAQPRVEKYSAQFNQVVIDLCAESK